MLLFAIVGKAKTRPFPKGRAVCPVCLTDVRAKCGSIKVHHWAHVSYQDCDSWSEGIGPWHLSWQDSVRPEFLEVPCGAHRADILGNDDIVIELQHSPISPDDIRRREHHYGNMLWLIDATSRFSGFRSGHRFFFSFGRTQHLQACLKPVVLDFGELLVEVEALTDLLRGFSGFGFIRDRAWFAEKYLSTRRNDRPLFAPEKQTANRNLWASNPPWKQTTRSSAWLDPDCGIRTTHDAGYPYLPLGFSRNSSGTGRDWPAWWDIIAQYPSLANGWTQADMQEMQTLLAGTPMILEGLVRLMPAPTRELQGSVGIETMTELIRKAEAHMRAGRLPILEDAAKTRLLAHARSRLDSAQGAFLARIATGRGRGRWLNRLS